MATSLSFSLAVQLFVVVASPSRDGPDGTVPGGQWLLNGVLMDNRHC